MARKAWAILVVWKDGEQAYLRRGHVADGRGPITEFRTRRDALEQATFMREGMDDVQSINVVRYQRAAEANRGA